MQCQSPTETNSVIPVGFHEILLIWVFSIDSCQLEQTTPSTAEELMALTTIILLYRESPVAQILHPWHLPSSLEHSVKSEGFKEHLLVITDVVLVAEEGEESCKDLCLLTMSHVIISGLEMCAPDRDCTATLIIGKGVTDDSFFWEIGLWTILC